MRLTHACIAYLQYTCIGVQYWYKDMTQEKYYLRKAVVMIRVRTVVGIHKTEHDGSASGKRKRELPQAVYDDDYVMTGRYFPGFELYEYQKVSKN